MSRQLRIKKPYGPYDMELMAVHDVMHKNDKNGTRLEYFLFGPKIAPDYSKARFLSVQISMSILSLSKWQPTVP